MWLSDYFLKKHIKDQQQKFYENPPEKELEPQDVTYKQARVHAETVKMNKEIEEKKKKQEFIPGGINQEKFKKLDEDMKETKDLYINHLKIVSTKENTHSQGKTHGMSR